ncbi:TetR family transcriptional regulator [Flavobacterium cyanobacteriorum]|uniref:TetR family transcriptional regulator n=1 Tax=Flavobacterium cyanobacteriorum TaxID=2022802 RepID=A0A255YUY0_9FLAO|nr:TetR/AcrR family transcriptional regulator [Flavobacterium cyanobacteriorum]OYQ32981.1 TetR family transcriptional regulator [Flavobacterium cyanobacteriorum]OYQ35731.1 TetR family transcriptional regulator [Flavobacterium cyanobacteriorum]
MGIKERKHKAKEDLRKAILNAAREIFLEKGYDNMSIRNIADRIEYSPTTLYIYFKDKGEIFFALHNEGFQLLNQKMAVLAAVADPMERLKAMGKIYMAFAMDNPDYYDLMFVQRAPLNCIEQEGWSEGHTSFKFLEATVAECMKTGTLKKDDPEVVAFVIWSFMHGMCTLNNRDRCMIFDEDRRTHILSTSYESFLKIIEL